jgi:hypothetical protein
MESSLELLSTKIISIFEYVCANMEEMHASKYALPL